MAGGSCKCGCGGYAKLGNQFIHGHNARFAHPMKGRKHSDETRKKLRASHQGPRPWRLGFTHKSEVRERMRASHTGVPLSEKHRKSLGMASKRAWASKNLDERRRWAQNISKGEKGKFVSEETKRKCSEANKGIRRSPKTEFTSARLKAFYRDPEYVKKIKKAWNFKPTKPERQLLGLLENLYPGDWKYTGDFSLTVNGKCPDFVNCNGQKKIIELFGDYWHRGENPQERIDAFTPFGFQTLVIWEHELDDMDSTVKKIHRFVEVSNER